jgi:hypothetical protein
MPEDSDGEISSAARKLAAAWFTNQPQGTTQGEPAI